MLTKWKIANVYTRSTRMLTDRDRLFTVLFMEHIQYPAAATIAAFGGPTKMAEALAVQKGNISRWQSSKSGLIPRWWSVAIKAVAAEKKIKLPKPQKAA